jgi:dimethylargininase
MSCHSFTHAILRRPARSVVNGLRAGGGPDPSYEGVLAEHAAYAEALAAAGVATQILDPLEEFPDSIFVEDPALVFGEGAILLNPGSPTRNAETLHLLPTLEAGFPQVIRLSEGYADGGDVMVTPDRILIGLSARTDRTGAQSLVAALAKLGRRAEIVTPPKGALHLKTISSMIDDETILTTRGGEQSGRFDAFRLIVVDDDEMPAANALRVNDTLLLSGNFARIAERLDKAGYKLALLDTTHINRIDAGLSCMSLRWQAKATA